MYAGPGGNRGVLTAWDPVARRAVWEIREDLPLWSGALATAGDLVFYGTMDGLFKAVDARTGQAALAVPDEARARSACRSPIAGPDGREYVAIFAGVGGWSGALVAGALDQADPTSALGFVNAVRDLPSRTQAGGRLYVFALPASRSGKCLSPSRGRGWRGGRGFAARGPAAAPPPLPLPTRGRDCTGQEAMCLRSPRPRRLRPRDARLSRHRDERVPARRGLRGQCLACRPGPEIVRLDELLGLPLARRRRDGAAADATTNGATAARWRISSRPSSTAGRTACPRSAAASPRTQTWQLAAFVRTALAPMPPRHPPPRAPTSPPRPADGPRPAAPDAPRQPHRRTRGRCRERRRCSPPVGRRQ